MSILNSIQNYWPGFLKRVWANEQSLLSWCLSWCYRTVAKNNDCPKVGIVYVGSFCMSTNRVRVPDVVQYEKNDSRSEMRLLGFSRLWNIVDCGDRRIHSYSRLFKLLFIPCILQHTYQLIYPSIRPTIHTFIAINQSVNQSNDRRLFWLPLKDKNRSLI